MTGWIFLVCNLVPTRVGAGAAALGAEDPAPDRTGLAGLDPEGDLAPESPDESAAALRDPEEDSRPGGPPGGADEPTTVPASPSGMGPAPDARGGEPTPSPVSAREVGPPSGTRVGDYRVVGSSARGATARVADGEWAASAPRGPQEASRPEAES